MTEKKKVVFATPTISGPFPQYLAALEASIPLIVAAGWDEGATFITGCPYISHARAEMTRKALNAGADVIVYLDHDVSWQPQDLLTLLQTEGDVVAGTYRYKRDDEEEYMGVILTGDDHRPIVREDGCIKALWVPAGFLKVTKAAIQRFMRARPDLLYGDPDRYSVDLFNHGAHKDVWWGEDVAFCRNWNDIGGEIWLIPTLNITHWASASRPMTEGRETPSWSYQTEKPYPGNYHKFLLSCPGGSEAPKE
jgi:hypothetical protein